MKVISRFLSFIIRRFSHLLPVWSLQFIKPRQNKSISSCFLKLNCGTWREGWGLQTSFVLIG